jgi:hypothetical protein
VANSSTRFFQIHQRTMDGCPCSSLPSRIGIGVRPELSSDLCPRSELLRTKPPKQHACLAWAPARSGRAGWAGGRQLSSELSAPSQRSRMIAPRQGPLARHPQIGSPKSARRIPMAAARAKGPPLIREIYSVSSILNPRSRPRPGPARPNKNYPWPSSGGFGLTWDGIR